MRQPCQIDLGRANAAKAHPELPEAHRTAGEYPRESDFGHQWRHRASPLGTRSHVAPSRRISSPSAQLRSRETQATPTSRAVLSTATEMPSRGGGGVIDRMHEWVCSTRMAARARCDCEPGAEGWSRPVGRSATASANATTSCAAATLSHRRNSERDQLSEACAIEDNAFTRTGNSAAACGRSTSTPSLIPCSQAECFVSELLGSEGNEFGGRPTRPSRRAYQGASTVCGDSPVRVLR